MRSTSSLARDMLVSLYKSTPPSFTFTTPWLRQRLVEEHPDERIASGGVVGLVSKMADAGALEAVGKDARAIVYRIKSYQQLLNYNAHELPGRGSTKGRLDGPHRKPFQPDQPLQQLEDHRSDTVKLQDMLLDIADKISKLTPDLSKVPTDQLMAELRNRVK